MLKTFKSFPILLCIKKTGLPSSNRINNAEMAMIGRRAIRLIRVKIFNNAFNIFVLYRDKVNLSL
jgi:hypothetical protein